MQTNLPRKDLLAFWNSWKSFDKILEYLVHWPFYARILGKEFTAGNDDASEHVFGVTKEDLDEHEDWNIWTVTMTVFYFTCVYL